VSRPQPVCLVAGVGPGVGIAVAFRFAREGFTVAMFARRQDALDGYVREIAAAGAIAHGFAVDVADARAIRRTCKAVSTQLGDPEVMVYNAAAWRAGPAFSGPEDGFAGDLALGVVGAYECARAVHPAMRAAGRGSLLFTGGGLALAPQAGAGVAGLTAAKSALRGFVYALAEELRPEGIHVATVTIAGAVAPGTRFAPERIAEHYVALHRERPSEWRVESVYDGREG
jgi:NAD(P)-dependent dehydrogenase (short-subunit alcohol dehydrogenase family)